MAQVGVSEGPFNNIFVTPDLEENHDKLMIIIQGSGAVRFLYRFAILLVDD